MKEVKRILKTEKKKDIPYSMYIDTHTHLHHRHFDKDRKQVLEQMEAVGIQVFLEVAMDMESNAVMREKLRKATMQVRFTAGVHPGAIEKLPEKPDEVLQQIAMYLKDENTVAVGEVGLDYCRSDQAEIQAVQRVWFHRFIELARTEKLPLVLHIRDAHEDALQILREHGSEHRGVVHCFQGSRSETSTGAYPARDRQPLCDTKAEEGKKYARQYSGDRQMSCKVKKGSGGRDRNGNDRECEAIIWNVNEKKERSKF